ncbi:MAG TPA: hypothetical protein PL196_05255, partial [Burkholderiaceae bacterium]|nr:hypothetical protein [Burkholderiaceae bacterium]
MSTIRLWPALALAITLLVGCGGGDSKSSLQITAQPAAQTVAEGNGATFMVSAAGSGALAYQWQRNGADIAGATDASYTLPAALVGDDGASFSVVVRDDSGSATSDGAALHVNGASATQTIGSGGGTLALASNAVQYTIAVPAGALAGDTEFTLKSLPPAAGQLARVAISPPGVAFGKPVTVTLTLPAGQTAKATQLAALQIGATKVYVPSTVDIAARTITTQLSYFGLAGTATPSRFAGLRRQALSARPLAADPPAPNEVSAEDPPDLDRQLAAVNDALVDLQNNGRFQDAAALQLNMAALARSSQVPELQARATEFLRGAQYTACTELTKAANTALANPIADLGDYKRLTKDIVYWDAVVVATGNARCDSGTDPIAAARAKLDQALTFVTSKVATPPAPTGYGPVTGEISAATGLASEATLLGVSAVVADTRSLYVDPALTPLRAAAFQTSLASPDQSEYLALLTAFGPTASLSDDAQYAATVFTVTTRDLSARQLATKAFGRGASVGTPVRLGTLSATPDGTVTIAGDIAVLHCPNPAAERLQILFEGFEVATLNSNTDELLSAGNPLAALQASALLRVAGIAPAKATQHQLQIKRTNSSCITAFGIFDDVLAAVTLDF